MNLDISPEEVAFRDEIRTFIADNYPAELRAKQDSGRELGREDYLAWHRILGARGWSGPAWPKEHGGPGWTPAQKYIFAEEMAAAGGVPILPFGINMVAPVIMKFGTDEQKARFLPPILKGETWWCQGYSEPGAGSDLASLSTKAVHDGDHYIVNGQKTWTTLAQHADWGFFLVRTDPGAGQRRQREEQRDQQPQTRRDQQRLGIEAEPRRHRQGVPHRGSDDRGHEGAEHEAERDAGGRDDPQLHQHHARDGARSRAKHLERRQRPRLAGEIGADPAADADPRDRQRGEPDEQQELTELGDALAQIVGGAVGGPGRPAGIREARDEPVADRRRIRMRRQAQPVARVVETARLDEAGRLQPLHVDQHQRAEAEPLAEMIGLAGDDADHRQPRGADADRIADMQPHAIRQRRRDGGLQGVGTRGGRAGLEREGADQWPSRIDRLERDQHRCACSHRLRHRAHPHRFGGPACGREGGTLLHRREPLRHPHLEIAAEHDVALRIERAQNAGREAPDPGQRGGAQEQAQRQQPQPAPAGLEVPERQPPG